MSSPKKRLGPSLASFVEGDKFGLRVNFDPNQTLNTYSKKTLEKSSPNNHDQTFNSKLSSRNASKITRGNNNSILFTNTSKETDLTG